MRPRTSSVECRILVKFQNFWFNDDLVSEFVRFPVILITIRRTQQIWNFKTRRFGIISFRIAFFLFVFFSTYKLYNGLWKNNIWRSIIHQVLRINLKIWICFTTMSIRFFLLENQMFAFEQHYLLYLSTKTIVAWNFNKLLCSKYKLFEYKHANYLIYFYLTQAIKMDLD